jgi:hypothetical protein
MIFPKQENEIEQFAMTMAVGLWSHELDFPSVDPMQLIWTIVEYKDTRNAMSIAISQVKLAAKQKAELLDVLKRIMKDCLKQSEVDVSNNPEKLAEIGWGPRAGFNHQQIPDQPVKLKAIENENATIELSWKTCPPSLRQKGRGNQQVRNFIIERRELLGQTMDNWHIVASSYDNQITLNDQPKRINLEFRVKAVNPTGASFPSNTAYVTI